MGFTFYKPTQGKYARIVTAVFVGIILVFGCWELYEAIGGEGAEGSEPNMLGIALTVGTVIVAAVFLMGLTLIAVLTFGFSSRMAGLKGLGVKGQAFIDFLIDVEAELRKVAWPNRQDLWSSTWVVIITMIVFAAFLVLMDRVLQFGMSLMGRL